MKWLVIQSDGQHKGQDGWEPNWMMRECYAIQNALLVFGDRAETWGLRHKNYGETPDFYSYDGIFTIENYELDWLPDVSRCWRALRLYWLIDAHWQPIETFDRVLQGYDVVLHSTRRFIPAYQERFPNLKHVYFPNGVDNRFFDQERYVTRPHSRGIIFIGGNAAPRAAAIDQMVAQCGMSYAYGVTGAAYIRAVLNAKIQFNKGLNGDINYRNWETIGLGTCLLTEHDPEMEALGFQHDVNCLFYRTVDEAVELAKTYIANGQWERIAQAGYRLSQRHSYIERIKHLLPNLFRPDLCQPQKYNTALAGQIA